MAPETLALFREAMSELRRSSGARLDDDSALLLMARHILGGPSEAGRASYQVALSVCPECGKGGQNASGELVPVGAEVVAMADCDGQHLGLLDAPVANANVTPNDGAHTGAPSQAEVGGPGAHTGARTRAKQTIAPATRRAVLHRDHRRCTVPGCRNVLFLDLHHLELRSEGGRNEADNLITLCGAHHRAAHRGELGVAGSVSTGVRFQHADGSEYGQLTQPRVAETRAKAFAALRNLGFRERSIRQVLTELSQYGDGQEQNLEGVLRSALARLAAPCTT